MAVFQYSMISGRFSSPGGCSSWRFFLSLFGGSFGVVSLSGWV